MVRLIGIKKDVLPGKGRRIEEVMIPDKGKIGLTKKEDRWSPEIKSGALKGWSKDLPSEKRHEILSGLVRNEGYRDTVSKLTWLRNISTDRETTAKAKEDWLYLKRKFRG